MGEGREEIREREYGRDVEEEIWERGEMEYRRGDM